MCYLHDEDAADLFCEQAAEASLQRDASRAPDPEEGLDLIFLTDLATAGLARSNSTGPAHPVFPPVTMGALDWRNLMGVTER